MSQEILNIKFFSPEWEYAASYYRYPFHRVDFYKKLERACRVFINKFPFPCTFEIQHVPIRKLPAGGQLISFWIVVEVVIFPGERLLLNEYKNISQGTSFDATEFQREFDKVWKRYSKKFVEYKGRAGRKAI